MNLPPVKQIPSPNYRSTPIRHDLVILHMCEGSYAGSILWLCNPSVKASAHLVMKADGSEVTQLVPLSMKAWAEVQFNGSGVSIEIEGFTAKGLSDVTLNAAAVIAAWLCVAYDIPPTWAKGGQGRGVCCHNDLGAAGGGHVDICGVGDATWQRMMTAIGHAYDYLKSLPTLPPFALHGLPGPQNVVRFPDTTPTPSHNGAVRSEPDDAHAHATASAYPAHSVAALQSDLNALGAKLQVDGWFGAQTREALRAFQITHGLVGDGVVGPASWRALDAAVATL